MFTRRRERLGADSRTRLAVLPSPVVRAYAALLDVHPRELQCTLGKSPSSSGEHDADRQNFAGGKVREAVFTQWLTVRRQRHPEHNDAADIALRIVRTPRGSLLYPRCLDYSADLKRLRDAPKSVRACRGCTERMRAIACSLTDSSATSNVFKSQTRV